VDQDSRRRALIIGGGPGGLAACLALSRVGIEAPIFERAPELREIGTGLGVQGNSLRALLKLGVGERLLEVGQQLEGQEFYSPAGRLLFNMPQGEVAREFGTPSISVLRADLQSALLSGVDERLVHLGAECVSVEQDDAGVTAHFADGREERGALLVGADGIHSVVRKAVAGDTEPRYSGFTMRRAVVVPESELLAPDTSRYVVGRGRVLAVFSCGGGRVYWACLRVAPEGGKDEPGTAKDTLRADFREFPELAHSLFDQTPESAIIRTDIYDRDPGRTWVKGRLVLLGDSVHLTAPFIGQGAGLAIEDAVVLAKELSLTQGLTDERMLAVALGHYERQRVDRAAELVLTARKRGSMYLSESRLRCALRNATLRLLPGRVWRKSIEKSTSYEV